MPLYEYKCDVCGRFEKIVQFSDPPLAACPTCGGTVQKLFSSPAIQFKGSGFYITDYAKKVSSESSDGKSSDQSSSDKSDKSGDKSSGEKSSGDKSSGDKSSGDSSSTSAAPAPAAKTSSKD
jgi:putative FmdB family regulatory protein